MADQVCKKCEKVIVQQKDSVKCSDCVTYYHQTCAGITSDKKLSLRKAWKCEVCVGETSSTGSRASEAAQTTSILDAIATFRREINQRMDGTDSKLTRMQEDISSVRGDVAKLTQEYEGLKSVTEETARDVSVLKTENTRLSAEVRTLRREVDDLEQHTRKNNIIVSGVPVTPRENIFTVLESIARTLDLQFQRYDISAAHRLPTSPSDPRPPSIVVCFVSRQVKDEWMRAKRAAGRFSARDLHSSFPDHPIYLNDHLTRQTREIFNAARALVKSNHLAMVWTSDCRVLAKRSPSSNPFRVRSLRQVLDLGGQPARGDEDTTTAAN